MSVAVARTDSRGSTRTEMRRARAWLRTVAAV